MDATPATEQDSTRYYKVIGADGRSCHGGDLAWPLPEGDEPGKWVKVRKPIRLCAVGLHLTTEPVEWMVPEGRVYLAEGAGEQATDGGNKIAFERVRLLHELTEDELVAIQVFRGGAHTVRSGKAWASGSATVRASGSATVEAWGSATVRASDSATVRASDSATVRASDSATVRAWGSATVWAWGSATVWAWGSATVRASHSATVISDPYHSPSAVVALERLAAHVDRRGGQLVLRRADGAT